MDFDPWAQVWVHDGMSSITDDYQLCVRSEGIANIPLEGYFGVTAATGGLSDDHDVLSFITHRLVPLEEHAQEVGQLAHWPERERECVSVCECVCVQVLREVNEAEAEKLADKYSSLSDQFDQQRHNYLSEHDDLGMGDWQYEIEMEQNVRHIADMQAQLSRDIA